MASSNSLTSRLEELRSRNPQSPPGESVYSGYTTPTRYSGSFMTSTNDTRASLQRRFTADSNTAPVLSPIGHQLGQTMESVDMSATTLYKVQAIEKKRLEVDKIREQRRKFEAELEKFDHKQSQEEEKLREMASDLHGLNLSTGHQSEPTTPPEYRDQAFPSVYSRRNRYSASSLVSPAGLNTRLGRSGSLLTSPPSEQVQNRQNGSDSDKLPSKSVPGSRRGSSDKFSSYIPETSVIGQRPMTSNNRYSMPVTSSMKQKRESVPDYSPVLGMGPINTARFLFGDDDEKHAGQKESTTSPDVHTYLQMNTTDDKFPILVRNNHQPGVLSASSAALDLALSQSPGPESKSNGWPSFARHRHSQHSLPQNVFDTQKGISSPTSSSQQLLDMMIDSPTAIRQPNRHSMEASLAALAQKSAFGQNMSNGASSSRPNLGGLQSSYSTNDIPTLKNSNGASTTIPPEATHAQKHFHNHNASLGRIPPNAVNNRMSRDLTITEARREEPNNVFKQLNSELQASAAPFGPATSAGSPVDSSPGFVSSTALQQYASPPYYGGYGIQLMNMGMTPIQMANPAPFGNQASLYQAQNRYGPYAQCNQGGRFPDSQARIIQQRRLQNAEGLNGLVAPLDDGTNMAAEVARFTNAKIESYQGEIYSLCKDQHGCRYLQKQLESRNPEAVQIIFMETQQHVLELMTDPFGNYLCQKLLEHSNDAQRTVLVNNAASQMVKIALNQHGTRALQKMIEFVSTPEQIQTVIHALKDKVVELIQDLNGNHVIQKCLNRLLPEDAQFVFDAVGAKCVTVGTHRHGCCVLQRCIDHASGQQKADLIAQITQNAFALVQDPFGNYVLQYIIDLRDPKFTNPLCYAFQTRITDLSKHKFSSNVIEKCIRHAEPQVCSMMIDEMLNANELEKMLRDMFANYVVQTALDYADKETKARLVEAIRPILPAIRQTPYGRRIQGKVLSGEGSRSRSGSLALADPSAGHGAISQPMNNGQNQFAAGNNRPNGIYSNHNQAMYMGNGVLGQASYQVPNGPVINGHKMNNGSSTFNSYNNGKGQNYVHQPVQAYGRAPQVIGYDFF